MLRTVRVGYIPVTHCIPLYLGEMQGSFRRNGIDLQMIPLQGGPKVLEALAANSIDIGFSNVASLLLAREQGFPFIPITGGPVETKANRDHAVLVKADSPIRAPRDLRGRRIALNSRRNIDHLMLLLWLQESGIAEAEVTLVEVPFPQMEAALVQAVTDVDAIATAEPFITIALSHGEARVLSWNYVEVRERTFVASYVVTEEYRRRAPETVASFARVIANMSRIANRYPDRARAALARYTKIAPDVIPKVSLPHFQETLDVANIAETERLLLVTGLMQRPINMKALLGGQ